MSHLALIPHLLISIYKARFRKKIIGNMAPHYDPENIGDILHMSTGQQPNDKKTSEVYFVIKLATNGYYRWMKL